MQPYSNNPWPEIFCYRATRQLMLPGAKSSSRWIEAGGVESSSDVTFLISQPLRICIYHDLNGNGNKISGLNPGLDGWNFEVSGPIGAFGRGVVSGSPAPTNIFFKDLALTSGFPIIGAHLVVNGVDVGAYTLSDAVFTLATAMDFPPTVGQSITVSHFSGDTSSGGFLTLPDLLQGGRYTITETLQDGWRNMGPLDSYPVQKIIKVPENINAENPTVYFGNKEVSK